MCLSTYLYNSPSATNVWYLSVFSIFFILEQIVSFVHGEIH